MVVFSKHLLYSTNGRQRVFGKKPRQLLILGHNLLLLSTDLVVVLTLRLKYLRKMPLEIRQLQTKLSSQLDLK